MAAQVAALDPLRLLTDGSELTVFGAALREHGWRVPAYTFPDQRTDLAVLRFLHVWRR